MATGNGFVDAFMAARDLQERRRQFDARLPIDQGALGVNQGKLSVDQGDLALRQAAEQRAAAKAQEDLRQRDYERFMGPAEGLKKSPYGGAAASDIGTLEELWRTKDEPMEEPLPRGVQGPPTLQSPSGRVQAADAARAGIEDKIRQMLDTRYLKPAEIRAGAMTDSAETRAGSAEKVAGITADSRIRSEQIKAGAKASQPPGPPKESPADKRYYEWVKQTNPQLATMRSPLGLSQAVVNRIKRTEAMPASLNEALTPQEVTEFSVGMAGALSGGGSGGQVAQRLIDELTPQTWKKDVAGWLQYVRNSPQDAGVQDFVRRGMNMLARERATANESVLQGLQTSTVGYRDALQDRHRDKAEEVLKLGGLNDQQIATVLGPRQRFVTAPGTPGTSAMRVLVSPEGEEYGFAADDPEYDLALQNGYTAKKGAGF
jgi:hypothetical protein